MLTMKAKHATMLLTVTEVEGLSERMEELDSEDMLPAHNAHPSVVMVSNERVIHIYLLGSLFAVLLLTLLQTGLQSFRLFACF